MSKTTNKFSPEVRERAVRIVGEHRADYATEWAAMTSIAGKIGCTGETLRRWPRSSARLLAAPAAQTASDKDRLKLLEREVKELRRANEILRKASVRPFSLGPVALGPNLRRRSEPKLLGAKANGDVVYR